MLKALLQIRKLNILSIIAYRKSFLIQSFAMIFNDLIMIIVWYFFFKNFWTIGGLDFQWYIILLIAIQWGYCVMNIFFEWSRRISEKIMNGQLDSYLLLPKNILLRIICHGVNFTVIWDLVFTIWLLFFVKGIGLLFIIKLIIVSICAWLTYTWFMVAIESLWFWMGSSKELSRATFEAIIWPAFYPQWIFTWLFFKILFLSVLPVALIAYIPQEILATGFSRQNAALLVWWSIFFCSLWTFTFYRGLRKYESWNMINLHT